MLAAELIGIRKLRVSELADPPAPGPGEVQVRVRAVGICGSDLHYYSEGAIGDTPAAFPMVLGHEPAGEVLRIGAGVTGLDPGLAAALEPAITCGHCEFCLTGRQNVCERIRFLGNPEAPGFFREILNLPAANVFPVPRSLSREE